MTTTTRKGAIGALLDEYERALADLKKVIAPIDSHTLTFIIDPYTDDEDCRSIQSILAHVVCSGYGYAINIHNLKGNAVEKPVRIPRNSTQEYVADIDAMFAYTQKVLSQVNENEIRQTNTALKIENALGQLFDIEQMAEHAIVHVLRHRRQIENILRK